MTSSEKITYFAKTNHRSSFIPFGVKQADRLSHTYVIGKTGTGKTTLLETKISQDINANRGVTLIDPHGDLIDRVFNHILSHRKKDLIYFDIPSTQNKWGYNPLKRVSYDKRPLVASGILEILKKQFDSRSWGVKMEHILRNVLLTLLDQPEADFSYIPRLLQDKSYRKTALENVTNSSVKEFWLNEYDKYPPYFRASSIAPIQNKIGAFLSNHIIKSVLINPTKEIKLRKIIDENKILLVNLSKGRIGEDTANLLGGLLISSLGLAAFSRADTSEHTRTPHMLYVDEFQNFTVLSLINMMSELRKYKVGMILANQYLYQLDKDIREAVLGNVGTLISFRVGPNDARYLAKEFYPIFRQEDIINLPNFSIYLKLMINGSPSKPFSADTLLPTDI